jgi:hypothetical protein
MQAAIHFTAPVPTPAVVSATSPVTLVEGTALLEQIQRSRTASHARAHAIGKMGERRANPDLNLKSFGGAP